MFSPWHNDGWYTDADGVKLSREATAGAGNRIDYVGNLVLRDGSLDRILIPGGYVWLPDGMDPVYCYNITDHLGSVRMVVDEVGTPLQVNHFDPFGNELDMNLTSNLIGHDPVLAGTTDINPYKFGGKEWDASLSMYDFSARMYHPSIGRFTTMDPLCEKYYSVSPYAYCNNNPVNLVDPEGMSTHTDSLGWVLAVYDDNDLHVYRHGISKKDYTGYFLSATDDAILMGETEYWDEFVSPESHKTMTSVRVRFNFSFDPIVRNKTYHWLSHNLIDIAVASLPGGSFDIKREFPNTGGLLNGKYVTSRSAGNYLAGLNAAQGSLFGQYIEYETFQKLSGALHLFGIVGLFTRASSILSHGTAYGPAPTYGEEDYQYRQSLSGWNRGYVSRFISIK